MSVTAAKIPQFFGIFIIRMGIVQTIDQVIVKLCAQPVMQERQGNQNSQFKE